MFLFQEADVGAIAALVDMQNGMIIWMAVPDTEFTQNPFLPGNPEELMSTGQFNTEIEVIVGHNSDEGLLFVVPEILDPSIWPMIQENFDTVIPMQMFNIANASDITDIDVANAHKLIEYYVGSVENINEENLQGISL